MKDTWHKSNPPKHSHTFSLLNGASKLKLEHVMLLANGERDGPTFTVGNQGQNS